MTCGIGSAPESRPIAHLATWEIEYNTLSANAALDVVVAAQTLNQGLKKTVATCDERTNLFAYYHGTLVGAYSGSRVDLVQTSESVMTELIAELKTSTSLLSRKTLETCGGDCTATHIFGVVADPSGDFSTVQTLVKSWNKGELLHNASVIETAAQSKALSSTLWTFSSGNGTSNSNSTGNGNGNSNGNGTVLESRRLNSRAECRNIRVEDKDTCTSLASRCGIGSTAFQNFNKNQGTFGCNTLQPGQPVCCSSGTLPNITPDPSPDGTCATHEIKENQGCQVITVTYGITQNDLFDFNKKTWGWDGCNDGNPKIGLRVCVSKGKPPMPAEVSNADCGPTVPGTKLLGDDEDLASLNPCPLDVCCNFWGHCGTTRDFCIPSKSSTGNPGTSAPGENGCIANCGMELVNNNTPPKEYRKIGYFEGWNFNRKCLNMHVKDIEDGYTHIHFSFGEFTPSLEILIKEDIKEQWQAFLNADRDYKKILSFGGWEFSNAPSTSGLFRQAVSPGNRDAVADRLVQFAKDNGMDGLDFDWEYPGATDIEGSDPGQEEDGSNYLDFLKLLREKLPSDKSLSIATASSYWYLRGFPIKKMANYLDYIVFMTYDLHGQWDVGSKWSMEGCEAGNCLRSHVNSTETMNAMIMMTKAGVPSHKVVMGVSSYGRSFKMTDATCRGPLCTFEGARNRSPAKKGKCTDMGGYISNFEINEIIKQGGAVKKWYDKDSDSDYVFYDGVEWVAYMTDETKKRRTEDYKRLNFGGTTDWAIDLQGEGTYANTGKVVYLDPIVWQEPKAYCDAPCVLVFPPSKLPSSTTINLGKYTTSVVYGSTTVTNAVTKLVTTITTLTLTLPTITTDKISYSNVNISRNQESSSLWVEVSVPVPLVTITLPDGNKGSTTRVLSLPAWPSVTNGPRVGDDDDDNNNNNTSSSWSSFPSPITKTVPPKETDPPVATLPTWSTYPPYVVEPLEDDNDDDHDDHDGGVVIRTPCKLWFFNICTVKIKSLRWRLPPGIYLKGFPPLDIIGPGPPPGPGPGPKFHIKPPMPPWPEITIRPGGTMDYPKEPPCETESAEFCATTVSKTETLIGTSTSTITKTESACNTIYGCHLTDIESTKTVTSRTCKATDDPNTYEPQTPGCPAPAIVYPRDPENVGNIPKILSTYSNAVPVKLASEDWTAFFYVPFLGVDTMAELRASLDVRFAYYYEEYNNNVGIATKDDDWVSPDDHPHDNAPGDIIDAVTYAKLANSHVDADGEVHANSDLLNDTTTQKTHRNELREDPLSSRSSENYYSRESSDWSPSQVSLPKDTVWGSPDSYSYNPDGLDGEVYRYNYDTADASDTYVYVIHEAGVWLNHPEFQGKRFEYLNSGSTFGPDARYEASYRHGSGVAAQIFGNELGICPSCTVVMVTSIVPKNKEMPHWQSVPQEYLIVQLMDALDDIRTKGREGKATINMSFSFNPNSQPTSFLLTFLLLLIKLDKDGVLIVASAGNEADVEAVGTQISRYPARFNSPNNNIAGQDRSLSLPNMVVVSATNWRTQRAAFAQYATYITTFAPGQGLTCPGDPTLTSEDEYTGCDGTSFAAPQVAALANYFRSVPSKWKSQLGETANVKKLIQLFHRRFAVPGPPVNPTGRNPIIWNGQVGKNSCLRDWDSTEDWHKVCPNINDQLDQEPSDPGQPVTPCGSGQNGNPAKRQDGGGSCPLVPGGNGPGKDVDWRNGPSKPVCNAKDNCGGEVCKGYYCTPRPKFPHPPDYYDPKDPDNPHGQPKPSPTPTPTPTPTPKPDNPDPEPDNPGPTPTPEPPPPAPRCFTAHLLIATIPAAPDGYNLQIWDNGKKITCHGQRTVQGISQDTVLEYDCDEGAYVAITGMGKTFKEYRAADGWTNTPNMRDYETVSDKVDRITRTYFEVTFENGQCGNCPIAERCDFRTYCPDFDGTCRS
ncbi:hypothetical protein CC86DRAFT_317913 [Ophiobolus disseminans]|uniref:chitinase n=1 Tax=Ophiobolus disseminans TaxID=1469910 RepID=A0A6A7A880_9PLEO|nr:hypothetical protein CC86DRAFT_317913 [Ophiobolus disseminans]